ncbi:MAG: hypothetical protein ACK4UV_12220, partial [Ignavibacterium sp.]
EREMLGNERKSFSSFFCAFTIPTDFLLRPSFSESSLSFSTALDIQDQQEESSPFSTPKFEREADGRLADGSQKSLSLFHRLSPSLHISLSLSLSLSTAAPIDDSLRLDPELLNSRITDVNKAVVRVKLSHSIFRSPFFASDCAASATAIGA